MHCALKHEDLTTPGNDNEFACEFVLWMISFQINERTLLILFVHVQQFLKVNVPCNTSTRGWMQLARALKFLNLVFGVKGAFRGLKTAC